MPDFNLDMVIICNFVSFKLKFPWENIFTNYLLPDY